MKRLNRNNLNKTPRMAAVWLFVVLVQTVCMGAPLVIYDQLNLGGTGSDVTQTYTVYSDAEIPGGLNNAISSFQLEQGYMAVVADSGVGTGISKTYIANDGPLAVTLPAELNNNISFIRVVPWENVVKKAYCGTLLAQPDWLGVGSYYRWGISDADGTGQLASNPQYVPMANDHWKYSEANIGRIFAMDQVSHVLGLNEPDSTSESDVSVDDAIGMFPELQKTGLRIGSPSCTQFQCVGGTSLWLPDFMQQADAANIRVDYIGVHWYDWGSTPTTTPEENATNVFKRFKLYLSEVYAQYRRPIWITEFNANKHRSTATQDEFLELALPYLETLGYVERYMYFQPFPDDNGDRNGDFFEANDDLTSTGNIYSNQVSTPSYTSKTLPAPWQDRDIGDVATPGDTIYANGNFTVCAGGEGITNTADEFRYVYQPLAGDGQIVARVNSLVGWDDLSMGGVMIRETLEAGSPHAGMFISESGGARFQYRSTTDGSSGSSAQAGNPPNWVKLVRQDDELTGYHSPDGINWTPVSTQTVSMSTDVYIGLAACSYNDELTTAGFGQFCDAVFTDVSLSWNFGLSGYDAWRVAHGMTGTLAVATNDYDTDGVINLYEYGLDGNPTNAAVTGTDPVLGPIVQVEGTDWIEYIHLERTNTGHGLTYTIQWTADLVDQPWSNSVDSVVYGTGTASNSDFMTVTNRIPTEGKTQEFLRLRIDE